VSTNIYFRDPLSDLPAAVPRIPSLHSHDIAITTPSDGKCVSSRFSGVGSAWWIVGPPQVVVDVCRHFGRAGRPRMFGECYKKFSCDVG